MSVSSNECHGHHAPVCSRVGVAGSKPAQSSRRSSVATEAFSSGAKNLPSGRCGVFLTYSHLRPRHFLRRNADSALADLECENRASNGQFGQEQSDVFSNALSLIGLRKKSSKNPLTCFEQMSIVPPHLAAAGVERANRPGSSGSPLPPWDPLLPGVFLQQRSLLFEIG